jgi:hypothetical protein
MVSAWWRLGAGQVTPGQPAGGGMAGQVPGTPGSGFATVA